MKIVGNILFVLGIGGMVVATWWAYNVAYPSDVTTDSSSAPTEITAPATLPIIEVRLSQHAVVADTGGCSVRLLYPQVGDDAGISDDAKSAINSSIIGLVRLYFPSSVGSIDDAVLAFVEQCKSDWTSEIGYDIKLNGDGKLSIGLSNYLSHEGNQSNTTALFITFDVLTGKTLSLADLVSDDKLIAFMVKEKAWLLANKKDNMFPYLAGSYSAFVDAPTIDGAKSYRDDAIFYITSSNIVTFYNPNSIATMLAGPIEVALDR